MSERGSAGEENSGKQIVGVVDEKRNMKVKEIRQNNGEAEDDVPGMDVGRSNS